MTTPSTIDVHAHVVPADLLEQAEAGELQGVALREEDEGPVLVAGDDRIGPIRPGMADTVRRLRWMDERGIGQQWISPWLDLFTWHHFEDPNCRRDWVDAVNKSLAAVAAATPQRLLPVPFVDVGGDPDSAARTIRGLVEDHQPPAVVLSTSPSGVRSLGDAALEPLWSSLAALEVPVTLHPPVDGPSCAITPPLFQNVAGRIADTTIAVLELLTSGVLRRFPTLRFIAVHGGGYLPYQAHRLDGLERAGLLGQTDMGEKPSAALRRLWYDTVALDPTSIELLVARVGPGRVLLGTDAPFAIGDPDPMGTLASARLDADAKDAICCRNARALHAGARY